MYLIDSTVSAAEPCCDFSFVVRVTSPFGGVIPRLSLREPIKVNFCISFASEPEVTKYSKLIISPSLSFLPTLSSPNLTSYL